MLQKTQSFGIVASFIQVPGGRWRSWNKTWKRNNFQALGITAWWFPSVTSKRNNSYRSSTLINYLFSFEINSDSAEKRRRTLFYGCHAILHIRSGSWRWRKLLSDKTTAVLCALSQSVRQTMLFLSGEVAGACKRGDDAEHYHDVISMRWPLLHLDHQISHHSLPCLCPAIKITTTGLCIKIPHHQVCTQLVSIAVQRRGKYNVWPEVAFSLVLKRLRLSWDDQHWRL